ncbi:hypothetical protein ACIA8G_09980 [Lentzea sp. NPDC051213]|uniref:hypothetical protein n=1 Tax=Lentzea sp. NPDC051213 TaxID=3364126 RepID=UPI0037B3482C
MLKSVLSACLVAASLLVMSPAGSAQNQKPAQDDISIMGIGRATQVRFAETWIRFRPNPYNGEHLITRPGHDVATICWVMGADGKLWDMVFDHNQKYIGWTHEENLTVTSSTWCNSFGRGTTLNGTTAWVHLAPYEDWAHEVVHEGNNLASVCYYQQTANKRWDVVLEHGADNKLNRVGLTYSSYLDSPSSTPCTP